MLGLNHKQSLAQFLLEANGSWEDVNTGTMPGDEDSPVVITEPEPEEPAVTTPVMVGQPTDLEYLPIDEEDYEPTGADELGRACRLLLKDLPDEVAGHLWKKINKLVDKTVEDLEESEFAAIDDVETEEDSPMKEETFRRLVRHLIEGPGGYGRRLGSKSQYNQGVYADGPSAADLDAIEAGEDIDISDMDELPGGGAKGTVGMSEDDYALLQSLAHSADPDGDGELDPADVAADEEETRKKKYQTAGQEGMSLGDIAKKMGYSGPSGIKNMLYKLEDKMRYFAALDEVWFKNLMIEFAKAYVEELRDAVGENLDDDDEAFLDGLMKKPNQVLSSGDFRVWAAQGLSKIHKKKQGK